MNALSQRFHAKSKRDFLQPQKISRHLKCSICQDIFEDPVRTICGHTFCYLCIEKWAAIQKTCPLCKRSIRKRKLEKDLIALNIIDDLPARCMHHGCTWEGVYSIVKKHQRYCDYKPKKYFESGFCEAVDIENGDSKVLLSEDQVIDIVSVEETINNENSPERA